MHRPRSSKSFFERLQFQVKPYMDASAVPVACFWYSMPTTITEMAASAFVDRNLSPPLASVLGFYPGPVSPGVIE